MSLLLAILVGLLYAAGIYLMLRRSLVKLVLGLVFLGNGTNLLLFSTSRLVDRQAPILLENTQTGPIADPVPQALILTAIVISFAVLAFAVVLVGRSYQKLKTDDMDQLRTTDAP